MNFGEKLFQAKLLSRLSHKVCRLLSSPVLLRKFTITGRVPTLLTATVLWIGAITKKQLDKVKRKLQQFDVVFCNLLKGIKVVRRSPFGTWYRKLCGEAGLESSIIRNKMRMRHLASGTGLLWLLIVVNWWNMNSLEKLDLIPWYGLKWCG